MVRFVNAERTVDQTHKVPMQVICAGLPRCATSSLQAALEKHLDIKPVHHFAEVVPYTARLKVLHSAILEPDKAVRQKLLHQVFDGYAATTDFPGCIFYEDLMEMYPDAKVVLNKRSSAEVWARSILILKWFTSMQYHVLTYLSSTDRWHWSIHRKMAIWTKINFGIDDFYTADGYNIHNRQVLEKCKARGKEVLEFTPAMGWEPLCKFLNKPVPKAPFPHENDAATVKMVQRILIARGVLLWMGLFSLPVIGLWLKRKYL